MYWKDVWRFKTSIEYEFKYAGRYGAKGEKRQKKKKPTPEEMELQNRTNKSNRTRRLIKANFSPGDYWITLTYRSGTRKDITEVKADMRLFVKQMRKEYQKQDVPLKFIYMIEIGTLGGLHAHILLNRIPDTDKLVTAYWPHGHPHFVPVYEEGEYKALGDYFAKVPQESEDKPKKEQLKPIDKDHYAYSSSRNLIRPEPERKKYYRRNMRKLLADGPKPTPGYYIVPESIWIGTNRFTGYSSMRYIENLIGGGNSETSGKYLRPPDD
ncbi:MAG: hypothetical protein PHP50_10135 [Lachnospiraceae bacterium]|nr:hypothetical protein [Lachnospiraceae bacterium]